jgi:hypothetical protein
MSAKEIHHFVVCFETSAALISVHNKKLDIAQVVGFRKKFSYTGRLLDYQVVLDL